MIENHKKLEAIIGKHLKELRNRQGVSQEALSLETGLDRSYISMIERGKRNPTLVVVFRICEVLDTPPFDLVKSIAKEYESS